MSAEPTRAPGTQALWPGCATDRPIAPRLARAVLSGAALLAVCCVLFSPRAAQAQEELPPPPSPPPALAPEAQPEDEAAELDEATAPPADAPARPRRKPRSPRPDLAPAPSWSPAETPPSDWTPRDRGPRTEEVWYGRQTLVVDGLSASFLLTGMATETPELSVTGGLGYIFGGPIVHWAHGEVGRGFGSFGIRLGMPVLGAILFSPLDSGDQPSGRGPSASAAGFGLGMVGAVLMDVSLLTYERVPVKTKKRSLALQPTFAWSETTLSLGVAGAL